MKWGVRRYQNEDGTLTEAGKRRYDTQVAKEKYKISSQDLKTGNYTKKSLSVEDAKRVNRNNLRDYKKTKLYEKALTQRNISSHQRKYIDQYISKGSSEEEARVAAYKKVVTERALVAIGGVTVASIAAVGGYKYAMSNFDRTIKPGKVLQNLSSDASKNTESMFYASHNIYDNNKYLNKYAPMLRIRSITEGDNNKVSKMKAVVGESGLKIASEKNATRALKEVLTENPSVVKDLKSTFDVLSWTPGMQLTPQGKTLKKGLQSLDAGKIDKNVYRAFNLSIPYHYDDRSIANPLYSKLAAKGYGGIQDVNDRIGGLSGYNSADPLIVFGGNKYSKVTNTTVKDTEIALRSIGSMAVSSVASYGIVKKATSSLDLKLTERNDKIITDYKKEHPNTKMKDYQILDSYYKSHQ